MIIGLFLLSVSIVGTITALILLHQLSLTGMGLAAFSFAIFISFLLLSLIILLGLKRTQTQIAESQTSLVRDTAQLAVPKDSPARWFGANGRLHVWAKRFVFGWVIAVAASVYIGGGIFLVKDGIVPIFQKATTIGINWSSPEGIVSVIMPLFLGLFWLVLPAVFYVPYFDSANNGGKFRRKK